MAMATRGNQAHQWIVHIVITAKMNRGQMGLHVINRDQRQAATCRKDLGTGHGAQQAAD